jgi:hypothetical protein
MKFRSLENWDNPASDHALVFFAQLLEEMLFDYTLDTYKPSVLHTGLLCLEAADVIENIQRGIIKEPNLAHVLEELCKNLETDKIAQSLLPLSIESTFSALKNKNAKIESIKTIIDLLKINLSPSIYRNSIENALRDEILKNKRYDEIRRLSRAFLTHVISFGHHPRFIRETVHNFFWYGQGKINTESAIIDFLKLFPSTPSSYDILFKIDGALESINDYFSGLNVFFKNEFPDEFDSSNSMQLNNKKSSNSYALITDIEAKDMFSARQYAEKRLEIATTLYNIYNHKTIPEWSEQCFVKNKVSGEQRKVSKPRNSMQKREDPAPPIALRQLKSLIDGFSLEKHSFAKFHRSAQLHAMALSSSSQENQILNIWIALESLVPSEEKGDASSNIEHITTSLTNFLNSIYIERLIDNLVKDLIRWNSRLARAILKKVKGKKLEDRLARLLILSEYESLRIELESATKDFYLLRDRLDYFKKILASPASVAKALETHNERLKWQIRRIYRARNIIVHSGETPKYTRALIEHAHDYLDIIISTLVTLASNPKKINSVSQGFKFVELRYSEYIKNLKKNGASFTDENIEYLLFGLSGTSH